MRTSALLFLIVASFFYILSAVSFLLCQECRGVAVGFGLSGFLVMLAIGIQFRSDILAFPFMFILVYTLYSLVPGLAILIYGKMPEGYPIEVSFEAVYRAVALAAGGAIAFGWGSFLFSCLSRGSLKKKIQSCELNKNDEIREGLLLRYLFWVGLGAWLLGLALNLADLARGGGLGALLVPRVERLSSLAEARGSIPYTAFLFPGVALSGYAVWRTRRRTWILLWVLLAFIWVAWLLLQGDRRFLLYTVLMLVYIYLRQKGRSLVVTPRIASLGLVLYLLLVSFGHARWLLTDLLAGKVSLPEAIQWVLRNASLEWLLPQNTEFAGPYFTLLYSLEAPDWLLGGPLWGQSYLWAPLGVLPRSLYPGEKPLGLGFDFSNFVWANFQQQLPAPIGWGFSPVAEAYLNGGALGTLVLFAFLGMALSLLERVAEKIRKHPFWLGAIALLFVQMLNFQRIDLIWVLNETFWMGVGFFGLHVGWIVVQSIQVRGNI